MITNQTPTHLKRPGARRHPALQPAPRPVRAVKKPVTVLACGAAVLLLAACDGSSGPDMAPVGDGLQVIGFAVLGAAVVAVLGSLLR